MLSYWNGAQRQKSYVVYTSSSVAQLCIFHIRIIDWEDQQKDAHLTNYQQHLEVNRHRNVDAQDNSAAKP